jgi:hypothetical protein
MYDVSIILPSIRPDNLIAFYESAKLACQKYSFQIVTPSPYPLPDFFSKISNVKHVKTFAGPTTASQQAIQLCNSKFLYNTVDDGILFPSVIDEAIEYHDANLTEKDVYNMRYLEGSDTPFPLDFWMAHHHEDMRLAGIRHDWKMCMHYFMHLNYFYSLGGYDCRFETLNHAIHDLMFRIQADNGLIHESLRETIQCGHMPGTSGDHAPIHHGQLDHDRPQFDEMYSDPNAPYKRIKIDYHNWRGRDEVWQRRWGKQLEQNEA